MYDGYKEYSSYIEWMNECLWLYTLGIHLAVVSKQFSFIMCENERKILLLLFSFLLRLFVILFFVYMIWISCVKKMAFFWSEGNHGFRYGIAMVRHIDEK